MSLKETSLDRSRELKTYHRLVDQIQLNDVNRPTRYHSSFMPATFFYNYFVVPTSIAATGRPQQHQRANAANSTNKIKQTNFEYPPLKIWIPDTIISNSDGIRVWIYTDEDGYVRRRTEFSDDELKEVFSSSIPTIPSQNKCVDGEADNQENEDVSNDANAEFESSPVMVYKEPDIFRSTKANNDAHDLWEHKGNSITIVGPQEIEKKLDKLQYQLKDYALQKYIQPKGTSASFVRVISRRNKPPFAWMVQNIAPFKNTTVILSHKKKGFSAEVPQYCTVLSKPLSCRFFKLTPGACREVVVLQETILTYLEQTLHRGYESFAADYIKDEHNRWWFIQVKSFIGRGVQPGRAIELPQRIKKCYDIHTLVAEPKKVENENNPSNFSNVNEIQDNIDDDCATGISVRQFACKSCGLNYPKSQLPYKLTLKMIQELARRMQSSSIAAACLSSGVGSSLLFSLHTNHQKTKTTPTSCSTLIPASLYQSCDVCSLCYQIYQKVTRLKQIGSQFSIVLGMPIHSNSRHHRTKTNNTKTSAYQRHFHRELPEKLIACRFMFFFQTLYDIPKSVYDADQLEQRQRLNFHPQHSSKLYLRLELFGTLTIIPLDTYPMQESISTSTGPIDSDPSTSYWLPLYIMRSFNFYVPTNSNDDGVHNSRDWRQYLEKEGSAAIDLVRCNDPSILERPEYHEQIQKNASVSTLSSIRKRSVYSLNQLLFLGRQKIDLAQFRSSVVSKTDFYLTLGKTVEWFSLKGMVAMDSMRVISTQDLMTSTAIRYYHGIYLPELMKDRSMDPLSNELLSELIQCPLKVLPHDKDFGEKMECTNKIPTQLNTPKNAKRLLDKGDDVVKDQHDSDNDTELRQAIHHVHPENRDKKISSTIQQQEMKRKNNTNEYQAERRNNTYIDSSVQTPIKTVTETSIMLNVESKAIPKHWCLSILFHSLQNFLPLSSSSIQNKGRNPQTTIQYSIFDQHQFATRGTKINGTGIEFNSADKHHFCATVEQVQHHFKTHESVRVLIKQKNGKDKQDNITEYTCQIHMKTLLADGIYDGTFDLYHFHSGEKMTSVSGILTDYRMGRFLMLLLF